MLPSSNMGLLSLMSVVRLRFWSTVMFGISMSSWWTMPTPALIPSFGDSILTSFPLIST